MKFLLLVFSIAFTTQSFGMDLLVPANITLTTAAEFKGSVRNKPTSPSTLVAANCTAHGFSGTYYGRSVLMTNLNDGSKDVNAAVYAEWSEIAPSHSLMGVVRLGNDTCTENGVVYQYAMAAPLNQGGAAVSWQKREDAIAKISLSGVHENEGINNTIGPVLYGAWCGDQADTCEDAKTRFCPTAADPLKINCLALFVNFGGTCNCGA